MLRQILVRTGLGIVTIWGVVTVIFVALQAVPGGPASIVLQGGAGGGAANPAAVAALERELGLDRPIMEQYGAYIGGLVQGDLGNSIRYSSPVTQVIAAPFMNTIVLVGIALTIGIVAGVAAGTVAGNWPNSLFDRLLSGILSVAISTPGFVIAIFLSLFVGVTLRWLPPLGFTPLDKGLGQFLLHAILPGVALSFGFLAMLGRVTRTSVLNVKSEDWVRTSRGMGLSRGRVFRRHVFRNALNPVVTVSGLQVGIMLGATVLVEQVFNWPGVGSTLLNAINGRDYPMVQGIVIVFAVVFIVSNLVVDALYRLLDPRVTE